MLMEIMNIMDMMNIRDIPGRLIGIPGLRPGSGSFGQQRRKWAQDFVPIRDPSTPGRTGMRFGLPGQILLNQRAPVGGEAHLMGRYFRMGAVAQQSSVNEREMGGVEKVFDCAWGTRGNVKGAVDQSAARQTIEAGWASGAVVKREIRGFRITARCPDKSMGFPNRESTNGATGWWTKAGQGRDGDAMALSVELPAMIGALQYGVLSEGLDTAHGQACATMRALVCQQAQCAIWAFPQHHALAQQRKRYRPIGCFARQGNGPPPMMLLHG